jgi:putative ABC transport system permease protein
MTAVAALTIAKRTPHAPKGTTGISFLAMLVVGMFITFTVTGVIVQVEPWYLPRYVIPIAGMVLGNSMNGIALALERTFSDMDSRSGEMLALTALGATPWEAASPSIRQAMRAAMIPGINTLSAAGIVFIPGMMAGQLLAGADPLTAAPYQIVVMVMVATADVLGSTLAVLLTYRRRFSADDVYLERGVRAETSAR